MFKNIDLVWVLAAPAWVRSVLGIPGVFINTPKHELLVGTSTGIAMRLGVDKGT